jgi:hypothetical protein
MRDLQAFSKRAPKRVSLKQKDLVGALSVLSLLTVKYELFSVSNKHVNYGEYLDAFAERTDSSRRS